MAEYVQIAPGVEGYAYVNPETGNLVTLAADTLGTTQAHYRPATPDEIEGAKRGHAAQGFGQKALGLGEQAVAGASFGLARADSAEAQARSQVLEKENPNLKTAARLTGTILPALATGGALGAGLGAVGVSGRVAGALTFGAEELAQSAAYEMADAAETDRNVEIGNIAQGLLEGAAFLGAARFVGKLGRRTASAIDDVAGDPAQALARAQKASATAADVERATPTWAEAKHYAENVDQIHAEINELGSQAGNKLFGRNGSASRAHNVAEKKPDIFGKMKDADSVAIAENLERYADEADLLAEKMASPQARSTIKQHAERLRAVAGGSAAPSGPSLAGRSLEDLKALPIEGADDVARVEALKADKTFAETGRVRSNDGKQGITLVDEGEDGMVLRDGRHRLTAAQELGREDVWGRIVDGDGREIYQGPIGLKARPVGRIQGNFDVHDAAIAVDEYKKHLDLWREHLGQVKATAKMTAKANVAAIDEVLEPVRKGLEDEKVWGKIWAAKQAKENALWSGPEGIINSRARWQAKLMEREAGAAGRARQGLSSVPVFRMHGDMAERILGMSKHDRDYILRNMKQDIRQTREMSEIKRAIGGTETRAAVDESLADLDQFEDAVNEIDRVARTVNVHGARLKKLGVRAPADEALDTVATVAGAAGGGLAGGPVGAIVGGLASRGLKKMALDAMTPIAKESKAATLDELRAAIAARNGMRKSGKFRDPGKLDPAELKERLKGLGRKTISAGKETALEAAGGTAIAAGVLGVANMAAETAAIKELDQHSKDATERAMLTLASPDATIMPLPDIATRFRGEHPTLTDAYRAKMADLRRLVEDPDEFIARSTAAFQPLADAGHPEVAAKLITRMMVGARYLLENAPPSIAVSMFTPDGGTPDEIAILQFAPVWEAVWRPTDTVRDFAQRLATPSAVKAIRDVHPDVYARMLGQVFQTLAAGGPSVDFETKRYLDNTMQMGAALGRSFSPKMSDLLAMARQDNKQSTASLGGENNIAPETATVGFSKGPTAIR